MEDDSAGRIRLGHGPRRQPGFTLIELVAVIVIVGALAAIAVPRYIGLGRDARVAMLKTLAGALRSTAENVHALCAVSAGCDYNSSAQYATIAGKTARLCFGWLDAGDELGTTEIDAWVVHAGFTVSLVDASHTLFTLDGSPNPATCSVSFSDAYYRGATAGIDITMASGGC